jgi:hypothetical protein
MTDSDIARLNVQVRFLAGQIKELRAELALYRKEQNDKMRLALLLHEFVRDAR